MPDPRGDASQGPFRLTKPRQAETNCPCAINDAKPLAPRKSPVPPVNGTGPIRSNSVAWAPGTSCTVKLPYSSSPSAVVSCWSRCPGHCPG